MALEFIRQDGIFNENTNRVRFFALDAGVSVMFAITRESLEDLAGEESLTPEQLAATFDTHRERIEAVARRLYAANSDRGMGAVVIEPGHLGRL